MREGKKRIMVIYNRCKHTYNVTKHAKEREGGRIAGEGHWEANYIFVAEKSQKNRKLQ